MPAKNFFESFKDSINQIVSGDERAEPSGEEKQRKQAAHNEIESAVIVLATELMRLDGNYTSESRKVLIDFLERNFGKVNTKKRNELINDHLFVGPQAFTKMACEQLKSLATHGSKHEIIRLLYEIATLDDFITSRENTVIAKMARYLEISPDELRSIKEKYGRINNPFVVLEMEETISIAAVKAAYRKVVLKYHPDKRKDKAPIEEANRKFREIKKAYEMILKKLG